MPKKTLFLWLNKSEFAKSINIENVDIDVVFKFKGKLYNFIRKISIILCLPFESFFYETWKERIKEYDCIIITASKVTVHIASYIQKKHPKSKIYVWYWNPVSKCVMPDKFKYNYKNIYSFDPKDCEVYDLQFNTQYWSSQLLDQLSDTDAVEVDFLFVGYDKGRLNALKSLEKVLINHGYTTDFHIVESKEGHGDYPYKKAIAYIEVLQKIKKCKCVVDMVSPGQHGLTLRPLEAVFMDKKLLTDQDLQNEKFYCSNILKIDETFEDRIDDFMNKEFVSYPKKHYYDCTEWLKRFPL